MSRQGCGRYVMSSDSLYAEAKSRSQGSVYPPGRQCRNECAEEGRRMYLLFPTTMDTTSRCVDIRMAAPSKELRARVMSPALEVMRHRWWCWLAVPACGAGVVALTRQDRQLRRPRQTDRVRTSLSWLSRRSLPTGQRARSVPWYNHYQGRECRRSASRRD